MAIEILDPAYEGTAADFVPAPRLATLAGATVAIVSNGKKGTPAFFDALAAALVGTHGVGEVVRLTKSSYSAPVEAALLNDAERWNALVAGIGD